MTVRYELVVGDAAGSLMGSVLAGFEVAAAQGGGLRLVGDLADQAALTGLLNRLQDLQVEIIEFRRVRRDR